MTTFLYFVELDGIKMEIDMIDKYLQERIKIEIDKFDKNLHEIERYLTNGDWTLAEYWAKRVMNGYVELYIGLIKADLDKKGFRADLGEPVL